jgi:hypothetical protein
MPRSGSQTMLTFAIARLPRDPVLVAAFNG